MAYLFDSGIFSVEGLTGEILPGAKLYWYASGTSTPLATYSDAALTVPNANPVIADAAGRFPAIWLQTLLYKMVLKSAADVTLVTREPINSLAGTGGAASIGKAGGGTVQDAIDTVDDITGTNGATEINYLDPGTGAIPRTMYQVTLDRGVDVTYYGAKLDGTTNDYPAFLLALAAAKARGAPLFIPPGQAKWDLTSVGTAIWDPTILVRGARRAIPVRGSGIAQTVISIVNASSIAWQITSSTDWYDLCMSDFTILGDFAFPLLTIGDNAFSDPVNMMDLTNISVENSANNAAAEAIRMNYIAGGHCRGVRAVCYADGAGNNNGTALRLRQVEFTTFTGGAFGNAERGVDFTDGVSLGCTFIGQTFENTDIAISHRQANSGGHTFIGSQITENTLFGIQSTGMLADKTLTVEGANYAAAGGFPGAVMLDPANLVGVIIRDRAGIATPSVPASTVPVTNTTGRMVTVQIWGGTVTVDTYNGSGTGITNANPRTYTLCPGDTIAVTYTVAPTWRWSRGAQ